MFQFQTGSIKRLEQHMRLKYGYHRFNSKLVRLKADKRKQKTVDKRRFQFQTGSIKRSHQATRHTPQVSFNSKLVRLKVNRSWFASNSSIVFQFQTGSIKSRQSRLCCDPREAFQFQTGSIKSVDDEHTSTASTGFNSKLVRLKASSSSVGGVVPSSCFNSKLVRLKGTLTD